MQRPLRPIDAAAPTVSSGLAPLRMLQLSGCSRLCVVLGGFGFALSIGGAVATHQLLHEPLESVARTSSLYLATAFCTANDTVLTRLALAQIPVLEPTPTQETTAEAASPLSQGPESANAKASPVQVATLILDPRRDRWLQPLPPAMASAITAIGLATLINTTQAKLTGEGQPSSRSQLPGQVNGAGRVGPMACSDHGLAAIRQQTRVFLLQPRPGMGSTSGTQLLYALGPWTTAGGQRRLAVAFSNLDELLASVGESDPRGHSPLSDTRIPLTIHTQLIDHAQETGDIKRTGVNQSLLQGLSPDDKDLANERWVTFANSELHNLVTVDHGAIERTSRRAAALAFVMGLTSTMIIVLVSRYSQLQMLHLNQALRHESRTDGLTRLANRRAWDEALLRADQLRMRQSDTFGVVVVDLDDFKQINDAQGHHQGDQILAQTADVLRSAVRETDVAARLGGDEFGILLVNPSREGLKEFTSRLQASLSALSIKASIGASLCQPGMGLEATWAEADGSMYEVKQSC